MKIDDSVGVAIVFVIFVLIVVIMFGIAAGIDLYTACTNEQTITETEIEVQITHLGLIKDEDGMKYYASITDFGEHADTMEVTKEQYAILKVGDTITVICTVTENTNYASVIKYTIK